MGNEARAMMRRKLGAKVIEGKDIDHKTPVRANGGHGGNNVANLRVRSRPEPRLGKEVKPVTLEVTGHIIFCGSMSNINASKEF